MNVLILGANGNVGRRIARRMAESKDFNPTAFIRKEEQKETFESMQVPTIVESLERPVESIGSAFKGFDAVVFTAGSGGSTGADKTLEIDLYGAVKAMDAAKANGIDRFVMISAAFTDEPSFWTGAMRPYYIAKHLADRELKNSGLDYTLLRPVRLTNAEEEGKIKVESDPKDLNPEIPREAVAEAVLVALRTKETSRRILEMSEGNTEIEEAISGQVAETS